MGSSEGFWESQDKFWDPSRNFENSEGISGSWEGISQIPRGILGILGQNFGNSEEISGILREFWESWEEFAEFWDPSLSGHLQTKKKKTPKNLPHFPSPSPLKKTKLDHFRAVFPQKKGGKTPGIWGFLGEFRDFGVSELVQPVVLGREIPGGDTLGLHKRPKLGGTLEITAAPDAGGGKR